ncbi:FecCD family ABC transporter permease [Curtobacterium sp. VKM Ac-1393]|uniref:FecCD family ABC transporter permease n=1 Tax=Curtobacterium sp. VKM Ac-1393 TaxID=2783814 RepID=UPI00188C1655|nr:iron chelate uptake ABC transporter family permease subunit [Curtobacterium sp. VKM Ac-1393]MBF4609443.1 iron chelate uptake ABC transporter family permease subunit [Curtobacterium sp. VKM Ac-1393]
MRASRRRGQGTLTWIVLLGLLVSAAIAGVTTGPLQLTWPQTWAALTGSGSDASQFIVLNQRIPRVACAIGVGAALGVSGMVFQRISRNPLGSPDLIGFSTGAATGGLVAILTVSSASATTIASGTVLGGFATATAVYLLSASSRATGERLILVGIAVGAMLAAVNDYLLTRTDLERAQAAAAWKFGSLNAISWPQVLPALVVIAALIPFTAVGSRPLAMLEMGDDLATTLGVNLAFWRPYLLTCGVGLAAVGVAAVGPISFVALAAPQLARRLLPQRSDSMAPSLLIGAVLLTAADIVAGRLLSPFQIPVGLVTSALGGIYLLGLLATRPRIRR